MDVEILFRPGNSAAKLILGPGETCTSQSGAMIAMSGKVDIETTTHKRGSGSIWSAAKRLLAGESLFLNHFTAGSSPGEVWISATLPGDMMVYDLKGETLIVQGGSFIACDHNVKMDTGWQGFKSLLSGENLFWIQLSGYGKVVLTSFGAIYSIQIDDQYIVDTGHIVAFSETLNFSITKAGSSWLGSLFSGEFLVCRFEGRGTVWCQSHNPQAFGQTLGPMLKPRSA